MDNLKRLGLLLVFFIVISHSTSSPSSIHTISAAKEKFRRYDSLSEQGLHTTLLNIEDKLRNLDSMRYSMNRWEISLERINNKVDAIESRTARMQTILQMKLESLSQAVVSSEMKHEWLLDEFRKYESNQERMNLKINSLESKFDDFNRKIQMNQDNLFIKLGNKHDEVYKKINEITTTTGNIKFQSNTMEEKLNNTNQEILQHLMDIENKVGRNEQFEKLTSRLDGIHNHLNNSELMWTQNDGPRTNDKEKMIDSFKVELNLEAQKLGNKVNNMYHEIWKKIAGVEILVKEGFTANNASEKLIIEDLRNLLVEQRDSESFIDISLEKVLSIMQKKFSDLHRKFDNNFESIATTQSIFLETCHRIQEDEPELESRVTEVLEKILDTFLNRTSKIEKQVLELLENLKSHNNQVVRIGTHNTNMVVTLAEEISQDHKNLDGSIMDVAERAETITSIVQELEDQILEFNETFIRNLPNLIPTIDKFIKLISNLSNNVSKENEHVIERKNNRTTINAIAANYGEGVLKIITDIPPTEIHLKPNILDNGNNSELLINPKEKVSDWLSALNNSINTTGLNAIVGTYNKNQLNETNHHNNMTKPEVGGFLLKIHTVHNNSQIRKPNDSMEINDEVAAQLMLSYIKLIKERITISEFLNEKHTGKVYKTITEMIQHLKPIKTIPREFIRELDQYDTKQRLEKGYLHENINIDPLNEDDTFNYDDTYDEIG